MGFLVAETARNVPAAWRLRRWYRFVDSFLQTILTPLLRHGQLDIFPGGSGDARVNDWLKSNGVWDFESIVICGSALKGEDAAYFLILNSC